MFGDWMGDRLDEWYPLGYYDYWSTCVAKNKNKNKNIYWQKSNRWLGCSLSGNSFSDKFWQTVVTQPDVLGCVIYSSMSDVKSIWKKDEVDDDIDMVVTACMRVVVKAAEYNV